MSLATASRLTIAVLILVGCATSKQPVTPPPSSLEQPGQGAGPASGSLADLDRRSDDLGKPDPATTAPTCALEPIFFGFNEAVLTKDAKDALNRNATRIEACIRDRVISKVTLEGHCDDRGTVEANLQLGQRRAEAAKKFLVNLGVPAKAVNTVSYGKERPVCIEQVEPCRERCRRVDFVGS